MIQDNIKISAIVTSFNQEETLRESILSIVNQDLEELIVIDDYSEDSSRKVIQNLARRNSKIKYIFNDKNLGVSYSLNRALAVANHNLVAIMAGDDSAHPRRLELHKKQFMQYPRMAAFLSRPITSETLVGKKIFSEFHSIPEGIVNPAELFLNQNRLCAPTAMLNLKFLPKKNIFKDHLIQLQDYWLWVQLSWRNKLRLFNDELVDYSIGDKETLSSSVKDEKSINFKRYQTELSWVYRNFFKKQNFERIFFFFPKTKAYYDTNLTLKQKVELSLIQYYLSHNNRIVRVLGIEMVYDLMNMSNESDFVDEFLLKNRKFFTMDMHI